MLVPFGTHTDTPFPMVHQCLTMFITTISEPAYISSYHGASYGIPRSGSALSAGTPSASIAKRKSSPVDSARLASKAAVAATPLLAVDSHGIATEMIILGLMSIYYLYIICYNTFLTLYRLSALPFFDIYQSGSMTPCQQISYPFGILSPESGLPSVQRNNETTPQVGSFHCDPVGLTNAETIYQWFSICLVDSTWYNNEDQRNKVITELADARGWQI